MELPKHIMDQLLLERPHSGRNYVDYVRSKTRTEVVLVPGRDIVTVFIRGTADNVLLAKVGGEGGWRAHAPVPMCAFVWCAGVCLCQCVLVCGALVCAS